LGETGGPAAGAALIAKALLAPSGELRARVTSRAERLLSGSGDPLGRANAAIRDLHRGAVTVMVTSSRNHSRNRSDVG
jgi:hypothetical protein